METFSALLVICAWNSPAPAEFFVQRPVARIVDVFFDLRPNKRLSKQSWGWWFETPSRSLWRLVMLTSSNPCYFTSDNHRQEIKQHTKAISLEYDFNSQCRSQIHLITFPFSSSYSSTKSIMIKRITSQCAKVTILWYLTYLTKFCRSVFHASNQTTFLC